MNLELIKKYEEIDVTDQYNTYFDSTEEIDEFCCKIKEKFEDLHHRNYSNICFSINPETYSEYGDNYTDVRYLFTYVRELTNNEIQEAQKEELKKKENEKIFSELCGKLSTNSIGSITQNDDLRKLYLEGNIKI